jgi:hypothetical protein
MQINTDNMSKFTRPVISLIPLSTGVLFASKAIQEGRFSEAFAAASAGAVITLMTAVTFRIAKIFEIKN